MFEVKALRSGEPKRIIPLNRFNFPSGEPHIKLDSFETILTSIDDSIEIVWLFHSSSEIFDLALLNDAIKRQSSQIPIHLVMPFFPCGRQDRVAVPGEPLSAKVVADFINSMNFASVTVYDVHSHVTTSLLNNAFHVEMNEYIDGHLHQYHYSAVISPDRGATERARKVANMWNLPIIECDKKRDPKTGQLGGFRFIDGPRPEDVATIKSEFGTDPGRLLIVDDICDGGGTFVGVAAMLKEVYDNDIDLFVTHGFFTKGMNVFNGHIEMVRCAFDYSNKGN